MSCNINNVKQVIFSAAKLDFFFKKNNKKLEIALDLFIC